MEGIFDIHCHILPGVDDGSESLEETMRMLKMEYEDGVRYLIATPHYRARVFETDMARIQESFQRTSEEALKSMPDLKLYLGCEFHVNMDMTDMLKRKERPTMAGSRYVLAEFSRDSEYAYLRERTNALLSCGYRVIIAHAERCECLRKTAERVEELTEMGARIQVNAESILGEVGLGMKHFCRKLAKMDLIHYVGTDAHGVAKRVPNMGRCADYLEKKLGKDLAWQILYENPHKIIQEGNTYR